MNMFSNTPTIDDLLAMDDATFYDLVTKDLTATGHRTSPFQSREIVGRTYSTLVEALGRVSAAIDAKLEDPTVSAAQLRKTRSFRSHLLHTLDMTEKSEIATLPGSGMRRLNSSWKDLLNQILDELEGDEVFDELLDEYETPTPTPISLREWLEVRRIKQPDRIPTEDLVETAAA